MGNWALDLGTTNTGLARWDEASGEPQLVELPRICRKPRGDDRLEAPRLVPSVVELLPPSSLFQTPAPVYPNCVYASGIAR